MRERGGGIDVKYDTYWMLRGCCYECAYESR